MTPKQKLELRASEIRARLAEIAGLEGDAFTDEIRDEASTLRTEMRDVEVKYQAATEAEAEPEGTETRAEDGEAKELRTLWDQASMGEYIAAALEMRGAAGAEAELNQALGMGLDRFPLEILAPKPKELRATTDAESTVNQQTWLDRLFANTAATRLGISMRSVAPGVASFPVTTAGASAAQRAREQAVADATWTVGVSELKPSRNGVRAVFTMEDTARLPGLVDGLRRDLGMAMTEGIDRAIFLGDTGATGTDADITGLTTANITEVTLTQANKVKGPDTLAVFAGMVDGIHAGGFGDLRVVATVGAWRLWESTIVNAAADNMTLAAFLRQAGMSWTSRGEIEAATGSGKFGAFVGRARGIDGAGVAAIWSSGQLIRDPYTGAAKGETALTLSYLWAFGLPRAASFQRLKFVT